MSETKPDPRFLPVCFACIEAAKANKGVESKSVGCFSHRTTKTTVPTIPTETK